MVDFTRLSIWIRSKDLSIEIYKITSSFPKTEQFGITSQIRRAAFSVPANISEGAGRLTEKDFSHFLIIAMGSLNELYTFIYISRELKYLKKEHADLLTKEINQLKSMIYSYRKKLVAKKSS